MIGIETIVYYIVFLLVAGLILGLLWWLIGYCESVFPGMPLFFKAIRVVFVILVVLLCISLLLGLAGHPVIRFGDGGGGVIGR
jgi:hypothetical protein